MKSFLKKLEYCFLVEGTKIDNLSFSYETFISEANVKTIRMVSAKWTYHKKQSFISKYFNILIFFFSLGTSCKELVWCTNNPNFHVHTSCKCWSFILRLFFPVSILKAKLEIFYYDNNGIISNLKSQIKDIKKEKLCLLQPLNYIISF